MVGGAILRHRLFLPVVRDDGQPPAPSDRRHARGRLHRLGRALDPCAGCCSPPRSSPFILAYIIVRGHALSWARGEMTAVVAIAAFGLVVYNGVVDRPGDPRSLDQPQVRAGSSRSSATVLMLVGSALRASEVERARKPPGVL